MLTRLIKGLEIGSRAKKLFTFSSNDTEKSGSMLAGGRPEPSPANQQSQFLGTSMLGALPCLTKLTWAYVTSVEGIRRRAQSDLNACIEESMENTL